MWSRISVVVSVAAILVFGTAFTLYNQAVEASADYSCNAKTGIPCVAGNEDIMSPKEHGTSTTPVLKNLRWDCDWKTAERICNFNRYWAEESGYWEVTKFLRETKNAVILLCFS